MRQAPIYKICTKAALQEARSRGRFEGSPDDLFDGFIHFNSSSAWEQRSRNDSGESRHRARWIPNESDPAAFF
jgi:uncharacterized protein (DUF952 family)